MKLQKNNEFGVRKNKKKTYAVTSIQVTFHSSLAFTRHGVIEFSSIVINTHKT